MLSRINRVFRAANFFLLGVLISMLLLLCLSCTSDYSVITEEVIQIIEEHGDVWVDSFEQPEYVDGIDILWIIDRSCSMSNDDPKLIVGVEAMINNLPTNNWRLSMIPMDVDYAVTWEEFPLVPGDDVDDAQDMLDDLPFNTSGVEQGFDTVESYLLDNEYADTWMRQGAGLLVVFVSDEDDQSMLDWDDFVYWLEDERNTVFVASIINIDTSKYCTAPTTTIGENYEEATNYFNGVIIDICSDDWSQGVKDAAIEVNLIEVVELSKIPEEDSIKTFVDGQEYFDWYYYSPDNTVRFTTTPDYGTLVEIVYTVEPTIES